MKGVTVKSIRTFVSALLAKVDQLLTTEPARMIGYGAAVLIYLAARLLADRGYLDVPMSFDQSIGAAFAAIASLVIVVESIRRFVYSPETYINDLSDEAQAAHEAAHFEEEMQRWVEAVQAKRAAQAEAEAKPLTNIGSSKARGAGDKSN